MGGRAFGVRIILEIFFTEKDVYVTFFLESKNIGSRPGCHNATELIYSIITSNKAKLFVRNYGFSELIIIQLLNTS